jgi:hypothetical protein
MAIIGTLPSRFSDKKTITLQRLPDTSMCIKIIYISVQGKSIGNIQKKEMALPQKMKVSPVF